MSVATVIFACVHNAGRSQMAAVETLAWPFDDPAAAAGGDELQLARFRRVRDEIDARLRAWLRTV